MKTRTFENHSAITTDANAVRVKSDYADSRGFGRDDTILVGPVSSGKYFLFDYFASAYDDGNGQSTSRTFLVAGKPQEVFEWVEQNRPEIIQAVGRELNLEVSETQL